MNKRGGGLGLSSGLVKLIGGMTFIWLLFIFWSSGGLIGFAGGKVWVMLAIAVGVLWIITRGRK